jgi:hypothetical protein
VQAQDSRYAVALGAVRAFLERFLGCEGSGREVSDQVNNSYTLSPSLPSSYGSSGGAMVMTITNLIGEKGACQETSKRKWGLWT